jgi:membrane protein
VTTVRRLVARAKASRPYRVWTRYGSHNGSLLAAGVGYFAFFSVFPALALAFTIFGFVLRGQPELLATIASSLNETLPGMVKTADNPTGIIGLSAPRASTLTITGVIAFVTLLLSGLGWIGALRTGIRAIYGLDASPGSAVLTKLRDLGVLLTLGFGVAASAILTSAVGGIAEHVARWVGIGERPWVVTVVGLLISVVFDTFLMVVLLRLLSGVPLPWAEVRGGAIFGAVVLDILKFFGGALIARATSNPLLGTVAVAVGLLFWLNLMSKVVLLSAAWAADDTDVARLKRGEDEPGPLRAHPSGLMPSTASRYAAGPVREITSSRAQDRVTLATGAVLGAAATALFTGSRWLRRR